MTEDFSADRQDADLSTADQHLKERLLLQNRMQQELLLAGDPQTVAEIGLRYLRQLLPAQRAAVLLINNDWKSSQLLASEGHLADNLENQPFVGVKHIDVFLPNLREKPYFYLSSDDTQPGSPAALLLADLNTIGIHTLLSIPLRARGELIGILNMGATEPHQFTGSHIAVALEIATPIALALHQAELYRIEKEQRLLAETLMETGNSLSATLDFDQVLDRVLEQIARVVPFDTASILMFTGDEAYVARHKGFTEKYPQILVNNLRFPIAETATIQKMLETRAPLVISDVTKFPGWVHTGATYLIRSWASMPVVVQNEILALICVDHHEENFYQPYHIERLRAFATQAGLAWQNARLHQATARQLEELRVLHEVAIAGTEAQNEDDFITRVTKTIEATLYSDNFGILLLDEAGTHLITHSSYQMGPTATKFGPLPITEGIVGLVARSRKPVRHGRVASHPAYLLGDPTTRSELCVPILIDQRILGVINTESNQEDAYSAADEQLLVTIASQLATGIDKLRYAAQLETRVDERTRELASANEQLLELDTMKSKFVADVSHELRTPLTNLSLYLDLFAHANPEKQQQYLEILRQQVRRLSDLVAEILSLSRIELGRDTLQFEPVDLNEIIRPVVVAHQPQINNLGLDLVIELQPGMPLISGEPNQLGQVITNLLTNAINYTQTGAIILTSWFDEEQNEVCFQMKDSGIGIDANEIPYLFHRFYRGRRVSQLNIPGTGLGLAIVQEIIKLHHGTIQITSAPEQGTAVTVRLPLPKS